MNELMFSNLTELRLTIQLNVEKSAISQLKLPWEEPEQFEREQRVNRSWQPRRAGPRNEAEKNRANKWKLQSLQGRGGYGGSGRGEVEPSCWWSLHERFPQDGVRTRLRCPGEGRLPRDGVPVEIAREGVALHHQLAGDVGRGELHHQPGPSQAEAGVPELLRVTWEMWDLRSGVFLY